MNGNHNDWINKSQEWRNELERALENHGDNDVAVPYESVALAFPSNDPSPHSFDYPLIDQAHFIHWAESKGCKVQVAPEIATEEGTHRSRILFTKK